MPRRSKFSTLSFIRDVALRGKIVKSIGTISELYLVQKNPSYSGLAPEIRRIIVLYCASVIEAVLLHLYKQQGAIITKIAYKDVQTLSSRYQLDPNAKFVIASQVTVQKDERELMLDVLLKKFVDDGIISDDLKKKIDKVKDIRNTLHLSKSRSGLRIGESSIQSATEAVYEILIIVQTSLGR